MRFARHDLVDKLAKSLAGRREICEAYLFGSQALGTAQDHSDVDVAVYVDPVTDLNRGFGIDAEIATDLRDFPETNYSTAWWGWMSMN